MLSAIGVPPDASMYLTVIAQQAKYVAGLVAVIYFVRIQRARHLRLSPGEQVRRHLRAGGYFP